MRYPEDARSLALAEAFYALVLMLKELGSMEGTSFSKHARAARERLEARGQDVAASALIDLVGPGRRGRCRAGLARRRARPDRGDAAEPAR